VTGRYNYDQAEVTVTLFLVHRRHSQIFT